MAHLRFVRGRHGGPQQSAAGVAAAAAVVADGGGGGGCGPGQLAAVAVHLEKYRKKAKKNKLERAIL